VNEKTSAELATLATDSASIAHAKQTLHGLNGQISAMRSVLTRLLQDVVLADTALNNHQGMQMLEANEFLTMSALRAQEQAETSAMKLDEVAQATGLDALTGLPNRVLFLDRFEQAIQMAKRNSTRLAVLFIDLDNFKQINDTLGHAVGDQVLKMTTRCLVDAVRAVDTVSRHGGDEFLVLLTSVATAADAVAVANKICTALAGLKSPSRPGEPALRLSASIGISFFPDHGIDSATLIERADAAMYRVKGTEAGGSAVHGEPIATNQKQVFNSASRAELRKQHGQHQTMMVDMLLRQQLLQEANEGLVLAALSAQDLQAAAEQALRRQSEFLIDVKNELRNPAAPIRIAARMLGRRRTDEPLLPLAQAMVEQRTEALARVVGAAAADASPNPKTAQRAPLASRFKPVDLRRVISAALTAYAPELKRRTQRMDLRLPDADLTVSGEAEHLMQALSNLLSNASKYTRNHGVITLQVEVTPRELTLTVSDTGIGISAAILPKVFDPFVQDTHAIGFNGVGLGIGLTAVREVIEAHRGSVEARSAGEGQGSQFIVTLPRLNAA
jgi:diguanylate cyclase